MAIVDVVGDERACWRGHDDPRGRARATPHPCVGQRWPVGAGADRSMDRSDSVTCEVCERDCAWSISHIFIY